MKLDQFILHMGPPLLEFAKVLFTHSGGDTDKATAIVKDQIKRIRDHGSSTLDPARAAVDAGLDELRKQGK